MDNRQVKFVTIPDEDFLENRETFRDTIDVK